MLLSNFHQSRCVCALYEVKSMLKNPPSTTAVAASIRKDQEPALRRTGCTESTDCTGCTECTGCTGCSCTGCTDCTGCTECTELACVADAKRGGGGGREKREKGKREGSACYKSRCFCIPPTIFSTNPITSVVKTWPITSRALLSMVRTQTFLLFLFLQRRERERR